MTINTKDRKVEAKKARRRLLEKIRRNHKKFRSDHKALAAEIAKQIRSEVAQTEFLNGNSPDPENPMMQWYQGQWGSFNAKLAKPIEDTTLIGVTCGTSGCVAGWATSLAGNPMVVDKWQYDYALKLEEKGIDTSMCWNPETKERVPIEYRAQQLLYLSDYQQAWLFSGDNTKDMVLWALDEIAKTGTFDPEEAPFDEDGNPVSPGSVVPVI